MVVVVADTGALVLTVHSAMMGLVTFTGKLREDYTACQATEWLSDVGESQDVSFCRVWDTTGCDDDGRAVWKPDTGMVSRYSCA